MPRLALQRTYSDVTVRAWLDGRRALVQLVRRGRVIDERRVPAYRLWSVARELARSC